MLQYLCVLVYLIHMYMCLFHCIIRGTECATHLPGQPYCPCPKLPAALAEGSCAPKIPSISTKLHHKPVKGQAITKELKKTATNILISRCMCHVGSRCYRSDLKSHHSNLSICSTVALGKEEIGVEILTGRQEPVSHQEVAYHCQSGTS